MKTENTKKNLYQKLLEIQRKVNGLAKDRGTKTKYNPSGYQYVTGSKVLDNIKPLMNELGLLLKQEIIDIENVRQDYVLANGNQKSEVLSKVMMRFTWVDVDTGNTDVNMFGANGKNEWEKGLGSALTYAERYFFLKFFHISTDEDDIDNPDRKPKELPVNSPVEKPTNIEKNKPIINSKMEGNNFSKAWESLLKGITDEKVTSLAEAKDYFDFNDEIEEEILLILKK